MNEKETRSGLEQALTRQLQQLASVAQQLTLDAQEAKIKGVPFPFVRLFTQACHSVMAELGWGSYEVRLSSTHATLVPSVVVSGGLALVPTGFAGSVTPARQQVISWQMLLFAVIIIITFTAPGVVLSSDPRLMIGTYDGILAAYAAGYMFSGRGKRNRR